MRSPITGILILSAASALALALSACSGTPATFTPLPETRATATADVPEPTVPESVASTSTPTATPEVEAGRAATPTPIPTPTAKPSSDTQPDSGSLPVATPFPIEVAITDDEAEWVSDRLSAVVTLYGITVEGNRAIRGLDFRWMRDEPGFFGSFGFRGWTGVGEAKPIGVIHELSHAYFGLFPVTGFPELGWDREGGQEVSSGIARYHEDVLKFMAQPPDPYELLRGRLRNLPEVSRDNTEPLFHHIEADAIYTTGGDLELLPPILRKYWDRFLQPGPFHTWEEAFHWYKGLLPEEVKTANKYVGFEHFDLRGRVFPGALEATRVEEDSSGAVFGEERRRLRDFVELFDLLLGTPEHQENFRFWRAYLRDKIDLHKQYSGLVASVDQPRAAEMAAALDFLQGLEGKGAAEKSGLITQALSSQPFLVHFLPALDDRTLLDLFASGAELPSGATLKGTAAFVESLEKFTPEITRILESGRTDPSIGARELTDFLKTVDFEEENDLNLFFEVLQGSDNDAARSIVAALDDSTLRKLLVPVPAKLRGLLEPARFLEFLDITVDASVEDLGRGIDDMVTYPSGNFIIDEPFLDDMYLVVSDRGREAPPETLEVIAGSLMPMERFIDLHPATAVEILRSNLDLAAEMVVDSDSVVFSPARFVYRLVHADPDFAAILVGRLDDLGEDRLVHEALVHFAYDSQRLRTFPSLPISLERDGQFLQRLLQDNGAGWLEERMIEAVAPYRQRVQDGELPADFLKAYLSTLKEASSLLQDATAGRMLEEVIDRVLD